VKYRPHKYGSGSRIGYRTDGEWLKGQHEAVISEELFNACQRVRITSASTPPTTAEIAPEPSTFAHLLQDLLYCYNCTFNQPENINVRTWGRMRIGQDRYRCMSLHYGVECKQKSTTLHHIHHHFMDILFSMELDMEWQSYAGEILADTMAEDRIKKRLNDIKEIINTIDFQWNNGFITDKNEYVRKRNQLREEVLATQLAPYQSDKYSLFMPKFFTEWHRRDGNLAAQHQLLKCFIHRIYIHEHSIVQIDFVGDYSVQFEA
jgi:hypothetical protein